MKSILKNTTKLPDEVRDQQVSHKDGTDGVSTNSKLVFLLIKWCKDRDNKISPSYVYMRDRFGIFEKTYQKALDELESNNIITTYIEEFRHAGRLCIDISKDIMKSSKFEMIPNAILTTDVYTNNQKIFLAMLWKLFKKKSMTDYHTTMSARKISSQMEGIGFSKTSVYKLIKELSGDGYIPVLNDSNGKISLNYNILLALSDRIIFRNEECRDMGMKYAPYKSPDKGDFELISGDSGVGIIQTQKSKDKYVSVYNKRVKYMNDKQHEQYKNSQVNED